MLAAFARDEAAFGFARDAVVFAGPPASTRRRLRRRRGARRRSRARAPGRGRGPAAGPSGPVALGAAPRGAGARKARQDVAVGCRWLRCRSEAWPDCAPTPPVPRWARRNIGVPARFQPRIRWLQWRARGAYAAPDRCHIMRGLRLSVTVGWRTCRNGSARPASGQNQAGSDAARGTERTHMSVVELQELEEVKGLIAKGQQVGVLTFAEIATRSPSSISTSPTSRSCTASSRSRRSSWSRRSTRPPPSSRRSSARPTSAVGARQDRRST